MESNALEQIDKNRLPQHIAIIMDGNGRWAKKQGTKRLFGHRNAIKAVREASEGCAELGVPYLTLYAFSTENWNRPGEEVKALMNLLVQTIKSETKTLLKNDIRLQAIGDVDQLPKTCYNELQSAMEATKGNQRMQLTLALNYSGRSELARAMQRMGTAIQQGQLSPEAISTETVQNYLDAPQMPDPELLIRTSGEKRISNFLLWQLAYSELYFTPTLWPDFDRQLLQQAILDYQLRERRFGKTSEQLVQHHAPGESAR